MAIDPGTAITAGGSALETLFGGLFQRGESKRREKERERVRQSIMAMIQQLQQRPTAGILDPGQQEMFVRQRMQQMQPRMGAMAQSIASRFNLNQPSAQRMLAGTMLSTEAGTRFGLGREMMGRRFESEENLRRLIAQLVASQPRG